jgi:integrase
MTRDVLPSIGTLHIASVRPQDVIDVIRQVEQRNAPQMVQRVRRKVSAVFKHAIDIGLTHVDPAASLVNVFRPEPSERQPFAFGLLEARAVLRHADAASARAETKLALRFLALTAAKPSLVVRLPWREVECGDSLLSTWTIPSERSGALAEHQLPLSQEAMELLTIMKERLSKGIYVFPGGRRNKPMCNNALGYLLNRSGYHHQHVPSGWRNTFELVMKERKPSEAQIIDMMLVRNAAHSRDPISPEVYLERARVVAQEWATLLTEKQASLESLLFGS